MLTPSQLCAFLVPCTRRVKDDNNNNNNDVVQVVRFNGYGEYSGLLYHSPHRVMYEDELYPTALHLFEALKFLDYRPDLADSIRECERVEDVTAISASFAEHTRRDWGNVALATVTFCSLSLSTWVC